jgi:hypothetical protein
MQRVLKSIIFCAAIIFTACNIEPDKVVMCDVHRASWRDAATIAYDNTSIERCDMSVMLHINRSFKAEEVELQITMLTPDSLRYTEQVTLPIKLNDKRGAMAATDLELPYRHNVELRRKGEYVWQITPVEEIAGVEAVGISFQINN